MRGVRLRQVEVLLVSLKAGCLGLNLTSASLLYMMDAWWNPAVEDQAINRVHRLGQTKPVLIKRLMAADTVEMTLLALQV
jgi:DNA repair protein RAD5